MLPDTILVLPARRIWNQRLLTAWLLVGLVAAIGVLASIPMYADAVQHRVLQGELTDAGTYRPPFAFLWRYVGAWHGDVTWQAYTAVDEFLFRSAPEIIGLPLDSFVRHVQTGRLGLFAAEDQGQSSSSSRFASSKPLLVTSLGFISGLQEHIELLEGAFPAAGQEGDGLGVLVSQALAEQAGLQVGEQYLLRDSGNPLIMVPVRVEGVWRPRDPTAAYWFYQPGAFDGVLLTSEPAFLAQVAFVLPKPVDLAVWYPVFDGSRLRADDVAHLLNSVKISEARTTALLSNVTLDASPVEALQSYSRAAQLLTVLLTMFALPIMGIIVHFVMQIGATVIQRDLPEIAVLRSRGMTRAQVLIIYALEGALLGGSGLLIGMPLGRWIAQVMGQTRTFLDGAALLGAGQTELPVSFSAIAWWYGFCGVGLAVLALLLPALAASRHTIISFRRERARTNVHPFWQRYFLDVALLLPALYGWFMLSRQGTLALPNSTFDPFANPLLFLVPALFCFSLALVCVRAFPVVMGAIAWSAALLPDRLEKSALPMLMLSRQLARSPSQYTGPMVLLSLTVSLAAFTASMAGTLDGYLRDQVYYRVGADMNLAELGEQREPQNASTTSSQAPPSLAQTNDEGPRWLFLPVSQHLLIPGVRAATRVGDYMASAIIGGRTQTGRLLGIDQVDFPGVAFFRRDFAGGESLGGLMNRLAPDWSSVLVSRGFVMENGLTAGDSLKLAVDVGGGEATMIDFTLSGTFDLFPTYFPQDGPLFVANLDYVYERLGSTFPYHVWLATDAGSAHQAIVAGLREQGMNVVTGSDSRTLMLAEQTRPERQGLMGLLSVGFIAAATLTIIGFVVSAAASFQRRYVELGMLRAVGLSVGQMVAELIGEQTTLVLTGIGIGTGLGALASRLFIPFFQVGADPSALVPPFVVQIAWDRLGAVYSVFAVMLVLIVSVLIGLLVRMRLFEALRLGETV